MIEINKETKMKRIEKDKTEGYTKKLAQLFSVLALVFLSSFLFVNSTNAEVATLKKSLIWSTDNSSDYKLPEISGSAYAPQDFIATSGQISSITVNWHASGKIIFEVSADNGLNYTQVTNGVPLKTGFISGNRLRWRAKTLSDDTKVYLVNIHYTDTSGVLGNFGEPTLSGFLYRKAIEIEKSETQDLYNYQLKLRIGENESVKNIDVDLETHTLADFKDIRFSAADGQTPLPYYLEKLEGKTGSRIATVWVKLPQVPKEGVIFYLYYGNDKAEDLSNPNATFDFYEDFKAASLDKNKWVLHTEPKGSVEFSNGMIKLDAAEIITKDFQFKEGIIEYLCLAENGFESSLNIRNKNEESYDSPIWLAYSSIYKGVEHCIAVDGIVKADDASAKFALAGKGYNYSINLSNGKLTFQRFDSSNIEKQADVTYDIDPMPKAGYLSLRSGGDGGGKNIIYFGNLRCRKAASILPVIDNIGKEERAVLPVFVDTTISNAGNIALKHGASSGYYLSAVIPVAIDSIRIIIPSWEIASSDNTDVHVGISADAGLTYKGECENAKYYYASKKDFSAGASLKMRIDLSGESSAQKNTGITEFSMDYRPGKITVTSPNGGEAWTSGTENKITWMATDYEPSYLMNIEYSDVAGKNYALIAKDVANSGEYLWNVSADMQEALIKVSDANDADIFDISDKKFSIMPAALTAGETVAVTTGQASAQEAAVNEEAKVIPLEKPKEEIKNQSGTNAYELLIQVKDNHSVNSKEDVADCFKKGDVVRVEPAGYIWGAEERENFLIVPISLTEKEAKGFTLPKLRATGKVDAEGKPVMEQVARRDFKLDLQKLGVDKKNLPQMREAVNKEAQLVNVVEKND